VQGLCAPRVKLERLEKMKAARAAAAAEAALPRLVRLLDYVLVEALVATLDTNLRDLECLLGGAGVLKVAVGFAAEGRAFVLDPPESTIALVVNKQVRAAWL
jgi:hypothetical protein